VDDPDGAIAAIEDEFTDECLEKDYTDGLSMICEGYRFNVRKSNTESVLRLNVEARANKELMEEKTRKLLEIISNG
ncbi:MAG: phosphomannomutase, partial [Desulfovibrionaceae bacterium]|nr:phosphomannomutase [Desulfovibrionaceae bacterium]